MLTVMLVICRRIAALVWGSNRSLFLGDLPTFVILLPQRWQRRSFGSEQQLLIISDAGCQASQTRISLKKNCDYFCKFVYVAYLWTTFLWPNQACSWPRRWAKEQKAWGSLPPWPLHRVIKGVKYAWSHRNDHVLMLQCQNQRELSWCCNVEVRGQLLILSLCGL